MHFSFRHLSAALSLSTRRARRHTALACAVGALVLGGTFGFVPQQSASAAFVPSVELILRDGSTWRGELGSEVELTFVESGVTQTVVGTLARIEKLYVVINASVAGKTGEKVVFRADLRGVKTLSEAPAATGSGGDRPAAAGGTAAGAAPAASSSASQTPVKGADGFLKAPKPGVFVLPLEGTVGIGLRWQEMDMIAKEADKYGPGQIIVFIVDSPGGLVVEGDKIHDCLKEVKKRHRLVAWIKEAISGAAFTALHCDEIYFMKLGSLGAITMFSGTTAAKGPQLQAWLEKCTQVAEMGGRSGIPVRAMIHAPLLCSYDKDPVTGRVTWLESKQGQVVLSDERDNLVFNASNALDSGFSDGTADTTAELAKLLQLEEWYEISDYGRKIHKDWQQALTDCNREVPKIVARFNFKGTSSGDAEEVIGTRMNLIRDLIKWWDRCPNGMMYDIPQKTGGVPDKDQLERMLKDLAKQMADIRKAKRDAGAR